MLMTDHEISYEFRHAKHRGRMIGVLADLNGVSRTAMETKLRELGLLPKGWMDRRRKLDYSVMWERYEAGDTDAEIAGAAGCDVGSVTNWRCREGLPVNRDRRIK